MSPIRMTLNFYPRPPRGGRPGCGGELAVNVNISIHALREEGDDCGTQGLRWIAETDNDLWERIQRREPNAYLVLLYWDSEMFRRTTRKRGELEEESEKKDYKALCKDLLFLHPERYTIAKDTLSHIEHWRGLFIKTYGIAEQKHYKTMYEGLLYGDPKMRILRILWTTIYNDHNARIKEEQNHGKH